MHTLDSYIREMNLQTNIRRVPYVGLLHLCTAAVNFLRFQILLGISFVCVCNVLRNVDNCVE